MIMTLQTFLPQDRRRALASGDSLPDRTTGSALFADISGFTPLTETLYHLFGSRQGAEELTKHLNAVYTALIAEVERYGGSVIGFAGDAITCWFDDADSSAAPQAVACGLALQEVMHPFHNFALSTQSYTVLSLKIAIATGPVRRFVIGDPTYHYLDTLGGATVSRMANAEHLANKGEVVVDEATAAALSPVLTLSEWRADPHTGERFGVVKQLTSHVTVPRFSEAVELDTAVLKMWMPSPVYRRERAGQSAFLTEFRPCVALFVRFVGIDYDTDEAESRLDSLICHIQAIAARYEGTLINLTIGDKGSYAYLNFGALQAHEDDAGRAIKAAQAIREAAQQWTWLAPLQIGLAQGVMWTGAYGGATRRTYSAFGDAVNLAARLMQTALPGEILVSEPMQRSLAPQLDFGPGRLVQLKGKADPLLVFAVLGKRQSHPIRLQEPNYALPMVGRQAELQTVEEKLTLARQGQAQIIGILAEAGLGKSRLVAEVIGAARQKGFVGYGGACQSDGIHTPYLAWKSIWNAFFNIESTESLPAQIASLANEIERLAPERLSALPLLGTLLNIAIPDNDFTRSLEPEIRQSALHALLEDCLKAAAQKEPILIVIEDLHWVDALSHDLLDGLAKSLTYHPVCLVLAYRPPQLERLQAPRLEALPTFTKIELSELSAAEAEQAIRTKLIQLYPNRGGAVPAQLVAKLMARTQGNPFFLEELLNFLRDRDLDPRDPSVLEELDLPDSLHSLILSRIDQLTQREKTTLRVASIIGRLFPAQWLTGYYPELGDLPQVKPALERLHKLDITPLDTPEPELTYLFKHIVTHEVTYESLPFAMRARLHEQLAAYLEGSAETQNHASLLDAIAHHYGQSNNQTKQREYFQKAGDAAQAAFANDAALDYFARLLPLLDDPQDQLALYRQQAAVLELTGHWDEAETAERAALAIAEQTTDALAVAHCWLALGKLFRLRGQYAEARTWLAQARDGFAALNDRTGLAHTHIMMGTVRRLQGAYGNARQELESGLALTQEMGEKRAAALALKELGIVVSLQSDFAVAQPLFERSLALCREVGDKWGISAALSNLGVLAYEQGNYAAARPLYEQSLAMFREMGNKWGVASVLLHLGHLTVESGDVRAAQRFYREALQLCQEMDNKHDLFYALSGLAAVAVLLVNLLRAVCLAAAAETLRLSIGGVWETTEGRIYERAVAAARDELGEARFQMAWDEGKQMTVAEAVAYALTDE
jgi:adenylate cyclase